MNRLVVCACQTSLGFALLSSLIDNQQFSLLAAHIVLLSAATGRGKSIQSLLSGQVINS
jgi:hypothetical protein